MSSANWGTVGSSSPSSRLSAAPADVGRELDKRPGEIYRVEPGDVLEVRIKDVTLRQDWGFNLIRPLGGTLPDSYPDERLLIGRGNDLRFANCR